MRKYMMILLFTISAASLTLLGIHIGTNHFNTGFGFGVGVGLSILTFIVTLLFEQREPAYTLGYFMNALFSGFIISEYYIKYGHTVYSSELLISIGVLIIVAFVVLGLITSIQNDGIRIVLLIIILIIGYIYSINGWINHNTVIYSSLFFILHLVYAGSVLIILSEYEDHDFFKSLYIASYVYFFVIIVVVGLIMSEGELLEGIGTIDFGGGKKPKSNQNNM